MKISRRSLLQGAGASAMAGLLGCGSKKTSPSPTGPTDPVGGGGPDPVPTGSGAPSGAAPHYLVLVTLRGGYDNIMSTAPFEQDKVTDKIYCGYRGDERIKGSKRMFGPLIGGLQRHDDDMCLIHGVRSDTVNHPDGLQMLMRGSRSWRSGEIATTLGESLAGDAPMKNLDMASLDGQLVLHERSAPTWAKLRAAAHQKQLEALGANPKQAQMLGGAFAATATLERFLDDAKKDASALDGKFKGFMGGHFRMAYQAIRGNWAKCIHVASRNLYFDSHSDNTRFQRERQPSTFGDLATFVDMLKSTKNQHGPLFDQTTIVVMSELGRFPRLNDQLGKDHWPENTWIAMGKKVKKSFTVGGLETTGEGFAVDFRSGQRAKDGRPIYLENGFATLVKLAGGDPVKAGYGKDSALDCVIA